MALFIEFVQLTAPELLNKISFVVCYWLLKIGLLFTYETKNITLLFPVFYFLSILRVNL